MDWLLATPQIYSAFSALGAFEGDTYVVSPNALVILEEINYKLTHEDQTLRTFRRAIGFGQNVRTDLIPLLENAKDDAILDAVIRILVNLTVPVECLFSVDVMYRTEVGRHTMFELNKLLYTSKEAFTDSKSTKSIIEYMKYILESESKLSLQKCDQINNCLLLLRNILHIPESNTNFIISTAHGINANGAHTIPMQNAIIWNLFIQSIDKLLIYLMTCPQRAVWGVTMVQLIALMYKDQHVSTLQKMLNLWFEASLSESSDDNESNTTPPKQGSGGSSPMLTSDPISDSSDNGSGSKKESSEDRRQALREETDATLQEVSRKSQEYQECQEYQNSMMRGAKAENSSSSSNDSMNTPNDFEQPYTSGSKNNANAIEENNEMENEEHNSVKDNDMESIEMMSTESLHGQQQQNQSQNQHQNQHQFKNLKRKNQKKHQPANNAAHTTANTNNNSHSNNHNNNNNTNNKPQDTFKQPPAVPIAKSSTMAQIADMATILPDLPPKPHQKVPHAGQLNLTKGKSCPQKRECPSSQSELSDCGYGTQVENQESISTSSNDDDGPQGKPQHQKPPCNSKQRNKQRVVLTTIDKKELRRKKLVRRGKSSLINMKGLVQHTPTDEDISNLLKEFTVDFLLKGYGYLVEELHKQLLTNVKIPIDTSHFFWLITYFLKFAAQLELDMEHISSILTYDIISYLTYEGVSLCEQLPLNSRQEGSDLKPYLRRIHLVVTAIREFLQAIETYKKVNHLTEEDRNRLHRLQVQISSTEDLRCLFVLLLSGFNPSLHTKQYLQDLVVTNHLLLMMLDSVTRSDENVNFKMLDHISQFATMEVMHHYGVLLEDFNNNGSFVNDCIFTMMHHVGGDLSQISTLFQPVILKSYSRIWEADYELCDDWSDLIEYVIHRFMKTPQRSPLTLPTTSLTELTKEHNLENAFCTWAQEEMDTLYWYYVQSKKDNDIVGNILSLFTNNGNRQKSRISIINQLLQQDIITLVEYDDLMKFEDAEYQRTLLTTPTPSTSESGIELKTSSSASVKPPTDDVQILRDFIVKENKEKHLIWLQKSLLECCYIKMNLKKLPLRENQQFLEHVMEPVAYHAIMKNKPVPIVQWNNEQAATMLYQPFVLLLHKLGFQLPADAGSIYARIPDYWSAETMFTVVKKLGSLENLSLKFDMAELDDGSPAACYHATGARNSISSISSFETDNTDTDFIATGCSTSGMLSPVAEMVDKVEKVNEIFAIPKAKHCHSIIRCTPDPSPMPPVPNWLQLVMRSKCSQASTSSSASSSLHFMPATSTAATSNISTTSTILAMNQRITETIPLTVTSATTATATLTETTAMLQHMTTTAATIAVAATLTTTVATKQQQQQHQPLLLLQQTQLQQQNTITTTQKQQQQQLPLLSLKQQQLNTNDGNKMHAMDQQQQKQQNESTALMKIATNVAAAAAAAAAATSTLSLASTATSALQIYHQQQQHSQQQQNVSDDDSTMKSIDRKDSISSGYMTRSLESEYSAMVAAVYENEIANFSSDTASVASDLTRMYVSDEDERHEIEVAHFHG